MNVIEMNQTGSDKKESIQMSVQRYLPEAAKNSCAKAFNIGYTPDEIVGHVQALELKLLMHHRIDLIINTKEFVNIKVQIHGWCDTFVRLSPLGIERMLEQIDTTSFRGKFRGKPWPPTPTDYREIAESLVNFGKRAKRRDEIEAPEKKLTDEERDVFKKRNRENVDRMYKTCPKLAKVWENLFTKINMI